jgi:hypothetical protein
MRAGSALGSASAIAIMAVAPLSFAQPGAKQGGMELVRFKAAQQLYDKGDFAGALILFQDVARQSASPNARLYTARCFRELGRLPEAYEELSLAIRSADASSANQARYVATRDAAAAERAALVSKIAILTLALADQPPGLTLKVGDRSIEPTNLRDPVALVPGAVVVEASAPGWEPFRKELTIEAGTSDTLAVVLRASGPAKDQRPAPPVMVKTGGDLRKAGFAVLGLGAVGGVTFAIAGALANSKYNSVYEGCGRTRCTKPETVDEISTGRTLDTVANVGLVVGVAGALGGAAMVFFGGPKEIPISAGATSQGAWATYSGRF